VTDLLTLVELLFSFCAKTKKKIEKFEKIKKPYFVSSLYHVVLLLYEQQRLTVIVLQYEKEIKHVI
jgi:hypothetical protein